MRSAMKQYLEPTVGTSKNREKSRNRTRKRARYMREETPLIDKEEEERPAVQGETGGSLFYVPRCGLVYFSGAPNVSLPSPPFQTTSTFPPRPLLAIVTRTYRLTFFRTRLLLKTFDNSANMFDTFDIFEGSANFASAVV